MQLFYHPQLEATEATVNLGKDESRHISQVLRKKEGDTIDITNGRGHIFKMVIDRVDKKTCSGSVISVEHQQPLPYSLHMAVAPTKLNDRFEWFLEKATEIGITEITPLLCEHSERKIIKPDRMERILQSAMKQSLSGYLPRLNPMLPYKDFIQKEVDCDIKGIAHCGEGHKVSLKKVLKPGMSCCILIGPEGDFSQDEVQQALDQGYEEISLGNRRLRTETAALAAVHSVAFINEH